MSDLPAVFIATAAVIVAVANVTYFRRRRVWRGAGLILSGALVATASAADHAWWLTGLSIVPVAWGLLILTVQPPDPADLTHRAADAFREWAKREGAPTGATEARSFMAGYVQGRADLRKTKGARQ